MRPSASAFGLGDTQIFYLRAVYEHMTGTEIQKQLKQYMANIFYINKILIIIHIKIMELKE